MVFGWGLDHEKHHEAGDGCEADAAPGEPEGRQAAGHAQDGAQHRCGAVFCCSEDCVACVVVYCGDGVQLFRRDYLRDIVVYCGFEAVLRLFEEGRWCCGADHGSEEGAEDEHFEENMGEGEAVRLVVLKRGFGLVAEVEGELGIAFFQFG